MASSMNAMFLKRLQNIFQIRPRQINVQRKKHGFHEVAAAHEIKACDDVFKELENEGIPMNRHPGAVRRNVTNLPTRLKKAAAVLLQKYQVKDFKTHSKRLQAFLKVRKHKLTPEEYEDLIAQKIKLIQSREEDTQDPESDMTLRDRAIEKLKPAYNWTPMDYTGAKVIQYLGARLAGDYSGIYACLREIKLRDREFSPSNVFDFGSGLGTTVWATNEAWKRVDHYYCVDHSVDMNTVARLLLQGGEEHGNMKLPVYFRTNMPSDKENKFDLVVCTYTLMELESVEERQKLVESLWNMTENYLVIVEKGGLSGFTLMNQAREHLLKLSEESKEGHIFAPCPHHEACPKLTEKNSFCVFEVKYATFEETKPKDIDKELFSYMIFKVGPKPQTDRSFPRLVDGVLKKTGHSHCYLCCSDAKLRHIIISASKHGKQLFKSTRTSLWGDMLPARVKSGQEEQDSPSKDNNMESNVNIDDIKKLFVDDNAESSVDNHPDEELSANDNEELSADDHEELSADDHEESPNDNEELSANENEELSADDHEESSNDNEDLSADDNEESPDDNEELSADDNEESPDDHEELSADDNKELRSDDNEELSVDKK